MTDELPFSQPRPDPTRPAREPAKCRRHEWGQVLCASHPEGGCSHIPYQGCLRCGKTKNEAASKRGKNNRLRGNAYERDVARRLGLKRVGHFGGPDDVRGDWIVLQVKNGKSYFSEKHWSWLNANSATADQLRGVVVGDAPGPGHSRREYIVLDLRDFIAWYGKR